MVKRASLRSIFRKRQAKAVDPPLLVQDNDSAKLGQFGGILRQYTIFTSTKPRIAQMWRAVAVGNATKL
jgi:CHASE1-domain containing sensor protein